MPSAFLRFFVYLEDQTNQTTTDRLGPVIIEFFERAVDGSDHRLQARVEGGGPFADSLIVPGATQLFEGEGPLTNAPSGILSTAYKPWADVWVEYHPIPLPPPPPVLEQQHNRIVKRIELDRPTPLGNFDFFLTVKRTINGVDTEIGRSELFRNCKNDLSDISPSGQESHIWISVPSIGRERIIEPVEYERIRTDAEKILADETAVLGALTRPALTELAAQSVAGLESIGLPPESPAKITYVPNPEPDPPTARAMARRRTQEMEREKRRLEIDQATQERFQLLSALQRAFSCQQLSETATVAHWWIPVDPGNWKPNDPASIVYIGLEGIPPSALQVPAAYFYLLGRELDEQATALDHYNESASGDETALWKRLQKGLAKAVINAGHKPIMDTAGEGGTAISHRLAARRLESLPRIDVQGQPEPGDHSDVVNVRHAVCSALYGDWLNADKSARDYWSEFPAKAGAAEQTQHLDIVRKVICAGIGKPGTVDFANYLAGPAGWPGMAGIADLKTKTGAEWRAAFEAYWGSDKDGPDASAQWTRLVSSIGRRLKTTAAGVPTPALGTLKFSGGAASSEALKDFFSTHSTFFSGAVLEPADIKALGEPPEVTQQLITLGFLKRVVDLSIASPTLVPMMEALYFRGFVDPWRILRLTKTQFTAALIGTIAYADAGRIYDKAVTLKSTHDKPELHPNEPEEPDAPYDDPDSKRVFRPVNHDGLLTDCIPPDHLSPFGPAAYASELLKEQLPPTTLPPLGDAIAERRGKLGELQVTHANTFTPMPAIDLLNEALESLVGKAEADINLHPNGELPAGAAPEIFQTSANASAEQLLAAPEHSTPSAPDPVTEAGALARQQAAYDRLRQDFSSFERPYHQPLEITRSYLEHMGTRRYETMRTFRKDIHEFVKQPQDMTNPKLFTPLLPTPEFASQAHLRRYPVRIDTAREYLKISEEEHGEVFTEPLASSRQKLWQFWGYPSKNGTGHNDTPELAQWLDALPEVMPPDTNARPAGVRRLAAFLKRSGLSYAEFRDLVACKFVEINVQPGLPEEEPCDIGSYTIDFPSLDTAIALERLAVFLRLRLLLRKLPHTGYSFEGITSRLSRAREQILGWEATRASVNVIETAVEAHIALFEAIGVKAIPEAERAAASAAITAAFADLPGAYAKFEPACELLDNLETRLNNLIASSNALVTQGIRNLAQRILGSIAAGQAAQIGFQSIEHQVKWLAGGITDGEKRQALMHQVRDLRVSIGDFSNNLHFLLPLADSIADLHDLLPANGPAVIRQAKAQAADVLPFLRTAPDIQAALTVASQKLDDALTWAPTADQQTLNPSEKLKTLTDALTSEVKQLRLFPEASKLLRVYLHDLQKLPQADIKAAVDASEIFLTGFNAEKLQDEIGDTLAPIRTKIESLPGEFGDAAAARTDLDALIDLIKAERQDGAFAGPLARANDSMAWWARQAARDYSFLALNQVCEVLGLYRDPPAPAPPGTINSDFIRQFAAMQMLRDDYALCLVDVLPLWLPAPGGADDPLTAQAKKDLATVIQERADCPRKDPKSRPLLADHFGEIADLTSLRADINKDNDFPAFLLPTHTLRFVETCFKVASSEFGVAELAFLYLNRHKVAFEDDPFHVEDDIAVLDRQPFADKFSDFADASMLRLQRLLRGASYGSILPAWPDGKNSEGKPAWNKDNGPRETLEAKFGFVEADLKKLDRVFAPPRQPDVPWPIPGGTGGLTQVWKKLADRLTELGFTNLAALGDLLTVDNPKFESPLAEPDVTRFELLPAPKTYDFKSPLAYDAGAGRLKCEGLLTPEQILAEVTRFKTSKGKDLSPCSVEEVTAIRDLYEQPRRTLARFALILPDQREAARRLLTPKTAAERIKVFVRYYFIFIRQFFLAADHLALHVLQREPKDVADTELDELSTTARYLLLHHIEADENWKDNSGAYHYNTNPNAKAIAAVLGLRGTGIWSEFSTFKPDGKYTNVFEQRFDKYVAQVPDVPPGDPVFKLGNYQKLPGIDFPEFPDMAGLLLQARPLVREISGSLNYLDHPNDEFDDAVGRNTNDWLFNAPKPLRIPEPTNHIFALKNDEKPVELRSGYQIRKADPEAKARSYGGGIPYLVNWTGKLQVATAGEHRITVCFKLPEAERGPLGGAPISKLTDNAMRIVIRKAATVLLTKEVKPARIDGTTHSDALQVFGGDADGCFHTEPVKVTLDAEQYDIELAFVDLSIDPSVIEVSKGPSVSKDRHVAWIGVFVDSNEVRPLAGPAELVKRIASSRELPKSPPKPPPTPAESGRTTFVELLAQSLFITLKKPEDFDENHIPFFYPEPYYFSSIRDIRRSYQRVFKALLFCHRFQLSCDEVEFLLSRGTDFRGVAFNREAGTWKFQTLNFDFNQWSVGDEFHPREEIEDVRQYPGTHMADRVWPLFDQWERFHDYVQLRTRAAGAQAALWNLFRDATDAAAPPTAGDLIRIRLGLAADVAADALLYTTDATPDFATLDKAALKTEEWPVRIWQSAQWQIAKRRRFSNSPEVPPVGYRDWAKFAPDVGSLRDYINAAYLQNGAVRRYANLEQLNAPLRENARAALVGYLTTLDRCSFPSPAGKTPFARSARDIAERLLMDVEAGACAATPRIEETTAALRSFVQRLRLGLEAITPDAALRAALERWDIRLSEYRRWQAWKYLAEYKENYREALLIGQAADTEAFQFLEQQLPEFSLTVDERGDQPPAPMLPAMPGLVRWEDRLPSASQALPKKPEGYQKLVTRERSPRRAALGADRPKNSSGKRESNSMRLYFRAPLEMDPRFIRLQSSTTSLQDDFYFWLVDGPAYDQVQQDAAWDWEKPIDRSNYLAGIPDELLAWPSSGRVRTVRLAWCRIRNGVEDDVRLSDYGMPLSADADPELVFVRRENDLLVLDVNGKSNGQQRFVYDPRDNAAHILADGSWTVTSASDAGGLSSFPHFIASAPGAPIGPATFHAPTLLVQKHLRLNDERDAAREWLEFLHKPLARSNGWLDPEGVAGRPNARVLLLNWLENLLDIGESQLAANRMATTEMSRETLALARKVLGERPRRISHQASQDPVVLAQFIPDKAPLNRRVLQLWDRADRLTTAIQRCENSRKIRNARTQSDLSRAPGTMPSYGYGRLGEGWMWRLAFDETEFDHDEWLIPPPHYRFGFLLQKALELCAETRGFGTLLMSAFEKGDAEELALLRSRHEVQINRLLLDVRRSQWREADWQLQALHKAREILQLKKQHLEGLIRAGYNSDERAYFNYMQLAEWRTLGGQSIELIGKSLLSIPESYIGNVGPFPTSLTLIVSGQKISSATRIGKSILDILSAAATMEASMASMRGSFARREEEWRHQVDVLAIELEQVRRQIIATDRRRDIALRELNIHQDNVLNAQELQNFQQNKFSNAEHHLWTQDLLAGIYRGMFDIAMAAARDAENAFRYERHYAAVDFLSDVAWRDYREGMTAGEQMLMALRRMEQAYLQQNVREHELSKSVSLRLCAPEALVSLRLIGSCEIDLPEWMLDLELPGQYRRRIKNVAISVLCATGPYQTVNSKLTLLSDAVRLSPHVQPEYPEQITMAGDPRFIRRYAAHQSIVTTSAQNDTGLFETNLRDERNLPFEGAGMISRWRVEIDPAANQFDPDSLSDVVLHFRYTAVDGGSELSEHAGVAARRNLPAAENPATKYLDVQHDFPAQWIGLREGNANKFSVQIVREMFPWSRNNESLVVDSLELFLKPAAEQPLPPALLVQANGQPSEITLMDHAYGPVYHGKLSLALPAIQNSSESSHVELQISAPGDGAVPRFDVMLVPLKYYFAVPERKIPPCDRFASLNPT
jgi:hypothetical protein